MSGADFKKAAQPVKLCCITKIATELKCPAFIVAHDKRCLVVLNHHSDRFDFEHSTQSKQKGLSWHLKIKQSPAPASAWKRDGNALKINEREWKDEVFIW